MHARQFRKIMMGLQQVTPGEFFYLVNALPCVRGEGFCAELAALSEAHAKGPVAVSVAGQTVEIPGMPESDTTDN